MRLTSTSVQIAAIALWTSLAAPLPSQTFDVVSIKPSALWRAGGEGSSARSTIERGPDSLTMLNVDLGEMVQWAYELQPHQLQARGKLKEQRYDVRAKSGSPASLLQMRSMLQAMLATRFKFAAHREAAQTSVFELTIANGGPKLPRNKAKELPPGYVRENLPRVVDGAFLFANTSIPEFAEQLSHLRPIGQPVVDRTGIDGVYDIRLDSAASAILQPDGPSLFTLIQEQLGLRLVARKTSMQVLVVDRAEPLLEE